MRVNITQSLNCVYQNIALKLIITSVGTFLISVICEIVYFLQLEMYFNSKVMCSSLTLPIQYSSNWLSLKRFTINRKTLS